SLFNNGANAQQPANVAAGQPANRPATQPAVPHPQAAPRQNNNVAAQNPAAAAGSPATDQRSVTARQLMTDARKQFNTGNVEQATQLARQAEGLGARYRLFDDSPEK